MKTEQDIPLSEWARRELSELRENAFMPVVVAIVGVVIALFWYVPSIVHETTPWYSVLYAIPIGVASGVALASLCTIFEATPFKILTYRRDRDALLESNRVDWQRAQALGGVFGRFTQARSTDYSVTEPELPGTWRPFRVEHALSAQLRGTIRGSGGWGWFQGDFSGSAIPDLLASSTILFLTDGERTLRVLVPTTRVAVEMFTGAADRWRSSEKHYGTHTEKVLKDFSANPRLFSDPLSHPELVDAIDLAIARQQLDERPTVRVHGPVIQEGVALATAIGFGDRTPATLLPTGYFAALAEEVRPLLGPAAAAPTAIEAVRQVA